MPRKKAKKKRSTKDKGIFTFKNSDGKIYEVLFRKPNAAHYGEADGVCYSPDDDPPRIYINPYLSKRNELNTCIHEFAHAFFWDKSEKEINAFANAISKFLYVECGWRKTETKRNTSYRGKVE